MKKGRAATATRPFAISQRRSLFETSLRRVRGGHLAAARRAEALAP